MSATWWVCEWRRLLVFAFVIAEILTDSAGGKPWLIVTAVAFFVSFIVTQKGLRPGQLARARLHTSSSTQHVRST